MSAFVSDKFLRQTVKELYLFWLVDGWVGPRDLREFYHYRRIEKSVHLLVARKQKGAVSGEDAATEGLHPLSSPRLPQVHHLEYFQISVPPSPLTSSVLTSEHCLMGTPIQ